MTAPSSVPRYWDVDGEPLNSYAWNITTLGDRESPPPLRGADLEIPHYRGKLWQPKIVDSRIETLAMWVIGSNEDGTVPSSVDAQTQFETNWQKLRGLLFTPERQFVLTKRFYKAGILKTASASAQFASGMTPTMMGPARGSFTVDLNLADPYYYGPEATVNLNTGTNTVEVDGDDFVENLSLQISGARTNVRVTNTTLGVYVEYHSALVSGDLATINVMDFTSVTDPASGDPFNSVGAILHAGHDRWLRLAKGTNTITVSSDSGAGAVTLKYRPTWW